MKFEVRNRVCLSMWPWQIGYITETWAWANTCMVLWDGWASPRLYTYGELEHAPLPRP